MNLQNTSAHVQVVVQVALQRLPSLAYEGICFDRDCQYQKWHLVKPGGQADMVCVIKDLCSKLALNWPPGCLRLTTVKLSYHARLLVDWTRAGTWPPCKEHRVIPTDWSPESATVIMLACIVCLYALDNCNSHATSSFKTSHAAGQLALDMLLVSTGSLFVLCLPDSIVLVTNGADQDRCQASKHVKSCGDSSCSRELMQELMPVKCLSYVSCVCFDHGDMIPWSNCQAAIVKFLSFSCFP